MGVLGSIEVFGKGGGVEVLRYWGVLGSTGEKGMEGGIGRRMERYGWRMGSAASATSVRGGRDIPTNNWEEQEEGEGNVSGRLQSLDV